MDAEKQVEWDTILRLQADCTASGETCWSCWAQEEIVALMLELQRLEDRPGNVIE